MLADLFEARVQIADVGHGVDHPLAVELQHQPQRGVRRRMLRPEIERPQVILRLVVGEIVRFASDDIVINSSVNNSSPCRA